MRDLEEIGHTIERDRPLVAGRVVESLIEVSESLAEVPERGARPEDARLRALGFRFLDDPPYMLFYKVGARTVRVHRFLHSHRRYQGLQW